MGTTKSNKIRRFEKIEELDIELKKLIGQCDDYNGDESILLFRN